MGWMPAPCRVIENHPRMRHLKVHIQTTTSPGFISPELAIFFWAARDFRRLTERIRLAAGYRNIIQLLGDLPIDLLQIIQISGRAPKPQGWYIASPSTEKLWLSFSYAISPISLLEASQSSHSTAELQWTVTATIISLLTRKKVECTNILQMRQFGCSFACWIIVN